MSKYISVLAVAVILLSVTLFRSAHAVALPDPVKDAPLSATPGNQSVVLAGGCFWGMQDVFQHVKGVAKVTEGYAGGAADTANYETVGTGTTHHAESIQITYDPSQITLGKLLKVYFAVAHDPTELNYQSPDHGSQYRSTIFYSSPEQKSLAEAYIAQLQKQKAFSDPIVTTLEPLKGFYPAEEYHENYARLHPNDPYIAINDAPKVDDLKKQFPDLYLE